MALPADYAERVYAGVLGKLIGVYLGRPFEQWSYEAITEHLGEINYYVHEQLKVPLIVTDDDISGTFTFLRALPDYGNSKDLTAEQIGNTWLNYLVEEETILWWGGLGNSTEHTAYLRLKNGIKAPKSGSIELNGKVVAEQIGSQIFIDGWAMVAPGNPELAADFAKRAGSVSHDGEAIYGAQVLAAMEAQAFVENDINKLIDTAVSFIPQDSVIYRLIADIRQWHASEPDWRKTREQIEKHYGYDKYGGNCHMVPNHGLIIFSLLYGNDDFQKSLMIVNTSGWDTDCNSGNVGCLLGIKNGLEGINAGPDWRGPMADRLYLPTADGGRAITDAVTESYHVINIGRALAGEETLAPKDGARFHFEMPGSVQGFQSEDSVEVKGAVRLQNTEGHSVLGTRSLALHYQGLAEGRKARVSTPTFIPSKEVADYFENRGYKLLASPILYAGQKLTARLETDAANSSATECQVYIRFYNSQDELELIYGPSIKLSSGESTVLDWTLEDTGGCPIASVGVELRGEHGASGIVYLDYLTWKGAANTTFKRPQSSGDVQRHQRFQRGSMWKRAWVSSFDHRDGLGGLDVWPESFRLLQNEGRGMLSQGTRDWKNYSVSSTLTPHMAKSGGIAARVQGLNRYYALLCDKDKVRLIKVLEDETVLAETEGGWQFGVPIKLSLDVIEDRLVGRVNGQIVLEASDSDHSFDAGGIALVAEEGRVGCEEVNVKPL